MKRLLLHVTDLDGFVWYYRLEDMSVDEMRARLLRQSEPNRQMLAGTAFHSVLENPPDALDVVERNGFKFRFDCDAEIVLPQSREIRSNKEYDIDGIIVTLTGKYDGASLPEITDHKLTFKPNPEIYLNAYQWKAYLSIFNADVFKYYIYSASDSGDEIVIKDVSTLKMYRYPEMEQDLTHGIRQLTNFIKEYVPEMVQHG